MNVRNKSLMMLLLLVTLTLSMLSLTGCKKKSEPAVPATPPAEVKQVVSKAAETEQTICPVMGGTINKDLYTEYKGKKVYFCCPGCKETFEKDPEKYLSKLPQFSN